MYVERRRTRCTQSNEFRVNCRVDDYCANDSVTSHSCKVPVHFFHGLRLHGPLHVYNHVHWCAWLLTWFLLRMLFVIFDRPTSFLWFLKFLKIQRKLNKRKHNRKTTYVISILCWRFFWNIKSRFSIETKARWENKIQESQLWFSIIIRLCIFILIYILQNIINKLQSRLEIVLPIKYCRKLCILAIYIFLSYYVHSVEFCTFKFSTNAQNFVVLFRNSTSLGSPYFLAKRSFIHN